MAAVAALLAAPAGAQLRPVARPGPPPDAAAAAVAAALPAPAPPPDPVPVAVAPPDPVHEAPVGPVTGLPLPRFVSLKTDEGNARRGPSLQQRVDWVFVREDMPLRIVAEYENWRRVEDRDGLGGWIHYSLLSGHRTVIVDEDRMALRARADAAAPEVALLEAGVVASVESCEVAWCRLSAGGYSGWAPKSAFWGVDADEVLD